MVASFAFGLTVAGLYISEDEPIRRVNIFADGNMIVVEIGTDGQFDTVSQGIWRARGLNSLTVDGVLVDGTTGEQTVVTLAFDENLESVTVALPDGTPLFTAQRVTMP